MKRLYKSEDKQIFGVCGGLAEYFAMDPTLVRLAWVILTLFTGVAPGVFGYIIAAMIMPEKSDVDDKS